MPYVRDPRGPWTQEKRDLLLLAYRQGGSDGAVLAFPDYAPGTIRSKIAEYGIARQVARERYDERAASGAPPRERPRCADCGAVDFVLMGVDGVRRCRDPRACAVRAKGGNGRAGNAGMTP